MQNIFGNGYLIYSVCNILCVICLVKFIERNTSIFLLSCIFQNDKIIFNFLVLTKKVL